MLSQATTAGIAPESKFWPLLDGVLRRREEAFAEILEGRNLSRQILLYLAAIFLLTAFYGGSMGAAGFTLTHPEEGVLMRGLLQMLASAVKVPVLYLLTTAICFPVLYLVVVLLGSKLSFAQTFATILLALALNAILLASFAPIIWFFTLTGSDYHFLKLLHVGIFGFSGVWAMSALWHGLSALCEKSDLYPRQAVKMLQLWILVFGFVGTQMAWTLRPFVGTPDRPFQVLRLERGGNFYETVWQSIQHLGRQWD